MNWKGRHLAEDAVRIFFCRYGGLMSYVFDRRDFRVYELYCLQRFVEWIEKRYDVTIELENKTKLPEMDFMGGAGAINRDDHLYLSVLDKKNGNKLLEIHTNINVLTLGACNSGQMKNSYFASEIDIVAIDPEQKNKSMLNPANLFIGLECKLRQNENLEKKVINEVIGVRSEISCRITSKVTSRIDSMLKHSCNNTNKRYVRGCPNSEYWLVQIGKEAKKKFKERLAQSNVKLKIWRPEPSKIKSISSGANKFSGRKLTIDLLKRFLVSINSFPPYR